MSMSAEPAPDAPPTRWRASADGLGEGPGLMDAPLARLFPVSPRDPRIARFRDALRVGDPDADALAAWVQREPGARALFERAVQHGIDAVARPPERLASYFRSVEHTPAWLDRGLVRLGTETMARTGTGAYAALGSVSLMSGYLASGAVKPLAMTRALTHKARRRLIETSRFVLDVASSGAVERGSPAYVAAVRVRLVHAMVRRSLRASPSWRTTDWGEPINQHDMVATNLQFSSVLVVGLLAQGYLIDATEREALMHLWRYMGHLLGVDDTLLPHTFAEGIELGTVLNRTEAGPDEDSRALAAALVSATRELHLEGLGPVLGGLRSRHAIGLSRLVLGRRAADELGLPRDGSPLLPLLFVPPTLALQVAQRLVPGLRRAAIHVGLHTTRTAIERSLEGKPPLYVTGEVDHPSPA